MTLKNGLKIANFSSAHPFHFDDGSVLEACQPERATALSLNAIESSVMVRGAELIQLRFEMTPEVQTAIDEASTLPVDFVLVPLPVLQLLRDKPVHGSGPLFVGIRRADRVSGQICSNRFCV